MGMLAQTPAGWALGEFFPRGAPAPEGVAICSLPECADGLSWDMCWARPGPRPTCMAGAQLGKHSR